MARSRLAKIGTIHSRTTGLLRAGAMKEEDKPLWLDLYEAFPPKDEPRHDRPASQAPIRDIFYKEDIIRAKYHNDHRNLPFVNLENISDMTRTQKFIAAYEQLEKDGISESELYETALSQTGKRGASNDDESEIKLSDSSARKAESTNKDVHTVIGNIFKD